MGDDKLHVEGSRIMLCEIGFACFVTVMGRGLRDVGALFTWTGYGSLDVVIVANLVHVVTLLAVALVCAHRGVALLGPRSNVASTVLFVLGYLTVCVVYTLSVTAFPLLVLCQACFGFAGALGMVGWVCTFYAEGNRASVEVLSASFFACIIGFALGCVDDVPTVCLLCTLVCIMSSVCALGLRSTRLSCGSACEARLASPVGAVQVKSIVSAVWIPALCIGALGFMSAVARGMLGGRDIADMLSITMLSEAVPCFVLIVLFALGNLRAEVVSLYKVLFPVGALAFLALTFLGGRFVTVLAAVAEFSFSLCSVLMTLQAIDFCRRLASPPTVVIGMFSGLNHAVLTLGYPLVSLGTDGANEQLYAVVAVVAIFVLAMVLFLAMRRSAEPDGGTGNARADTGADAPELPGDLTSVELSGREREVLGLILQGRDVPSMAEVLGLSKNTVRTHVKGLYAKLDVHSRQELIDLFRR